jgi:hypothetical protein
MFFCPCKVTFTNSENGNMVIFQGLFSAYKWWPFINKVQPNVIFQQFQQVFTDGLLCESSSSGARDILHNHRDRCCCSQVKKKNVFSYYSQREKDV